MPIVTFVFGPRRQREYNEMPLTGTYNIIIPIAPNFYKISSITIMTLETIKSFLGSNNFIIKSKSSDVMAQLIMNKVIAFFNR